MERTTGKEKMETVTRMATANGGKEREVVEGEQRMYVPRLSVDVEHVILLHTELEEAARHLRGGVLELDERDVLVLREVEVLPRLGLLHLFAADGLRHLLLLLDNIDDVAVAIRMALSVGTAGVEEDVMDGVDALHRGSDESVVRLLQSTNAGLAWLCRWTNLDGALSP